MVFDSRGMLQHYKRIYNAKPSPEIARTRASSANRGRPRSRSSSRGMPRRSTSFQALHHLSPNRAQISSSYSGSQDFSHASWILPNDSDNAKNFAVEVTQRPVSAVHSAAVKENKTEYQSSKRRPFSANVVHSSVFDPRRQIQSRPTSSSSQPKIGYSSQYQFSSSKAQNSLNDYFEHNTPSMKKFNSMHELNRGNTDVQNRLGSTTSLSMLGMRHSASLSDRIDSFLQALQYEQEKLLMTYQHQKQLRDTRLNRSTSNRPSISSSSRGSTAFSVSTIPSKRNLQMYQRMIQQPPTVRAPKKEVQKTTSTPSRQPKVITSINKPTPSSTFDTNQVTSKLKSDRNYQPPRPRKHQQSPGPGVQMQGPARRLSSSDNVEDYDDDFEAEEDEEEEEDTDTAMVRKKQAWLYDQYRRVRARQRAAVMVKRQESGAEKASSKDSAYGYSGGETSRLHTREPTPDYQQNIYGPLAKGSFKQRLTNNYKHFQRNASTSRGQHQVGGKIPDSKEKSSGSNESYVKFMSAITNEILNSGSFTEASIKRTIENHLSTTKYRYNLSRSEIEDLTQTLKEELGLGYGSGSKSGPKKSIQEMLRPARTINKSVILPSKVHLQTDSRRHRFETESYNEKIERRTKSNNGIKQTTSKDSFEEDFMLQLLRDETDLVSKAYLLNSNDILHPVYHTDIFCRKFTS